MSCPDIPIGILEGVEWKTIRSAFVRLRGTRTQAQIAKAGDLYQSDISKLESNDNLGPVVETFVKAVAGLGMTVSEFFRQIEDLAVPMHVVHAQPPLKVGQADDDEAPASPPPTLPLTRAQLQAAFDAFVTITYEKYTGEPESGRGSPTGARARPADTDSSGRKLHARPRATTKERAAGKRRVKG